MRYVQNFGLFLRIPLLYMCAPIPREFSTRHCCGQNLTASNLPPTAPRAQRVLDYESIFFTLKFALTLRPHCIHQRRTYASRSHAEPFCLWQALPDPVISHQRKHAYRRSSNAPKFTWSSAKTLRLCCSYRVILSSQRRSSRPEVPPKCMPSVLGWGGVHFFVTSFEKFLMRI